jgi:predicted transcriptional regulator
MKIHIGELIKKKLEESGIDKTVFAHRIKKSYPTTLNIFKKKSIKTDDLLKISKVLKYDFFRVYSADIQLTCPKATNNVRLGNKETGNGAESALPRFKKNLYSNEFIDNLVKEINDGKLTRYEAMKKYELPKTTLYRWCPKSNLMN